MEIFLYAKDYERIEQRLKAAAPEVIPILMHDDGSISRLGEKIEADQAKPEIAFASSRLYIFGPARDFMIFLLKSKTVRWVQSGAAGFDTPVFGALVDKGIRLTKSNSAAIAISEFVMASVLNAFQPFQERRKLQKDKKWEKIGFKEVHGTNWLIVGMGNIGREVAKRAAAFGCHVTGVRRNPAGDEPAEEVISLGQIGDYLPGADVVVISAALNLETRHMVDSSFLNLLKPSSILVNIARGPIIDENALLGSLDKGVPAYAILDVFESEPLPPESPFWTHPRVQVTAHSASFTPDQRARGETIFLENLKLYLADKPLNFEVNKSEFENVD